MEKERAAGADKAPASAKKKKAGTAGLEKANKKAAAAAGAKAKEKTKPKKEKKPKVVRDSFTLPAEDYAILSELKQACLKDGLQVKKSELVRAGLRVLRRLDGAKLRAEMAAVEKIKTGRPKSA